MPIDFGQAAWYRAQIDNRHFAITQELFYLRSNRNRYAPISFLPPEVLTEIFLRCQNFILTLNNPCVQSEDLSDGSDSQTEGSIGLHLKKHHKACRSFGYCEEESMLFHLSSVCKSWRAFIRNTPILWDTVYLHQPLFLLKKKVTLRRDIPVTLVARQRTELCCGEEYTSSVCSDPTAVANWVLETCPQIKALDLNLHGTELQEFLSRLSSGPSRFSGTKHISFINSSKFCSPGCPVGWGSSDRYHPLQYLPLSSLSLTKVLPPPWLHSTSLSSLRSLTLKLPPLTASALRSLRDLLVGCSSSLEDASLTLAFNSGENDEFLFCLANDMESWPSIHFPNLRTLHLEDGWGHLVHAFLCTVVAPRSSCKVSFYSRRSFRKYLDVKPMTSEWGNAIGNYGVRYHPSGHLTLYPWSRVSEFHSTYYPAVYMSYSVGTENAPWRTANIGWLIDFLQPGFINITAFTLHVQSFNEVFAGKKYFSGKGDFDATFLEEYPDMGKNGSLEAKAIMDTHKDKTYEELVGLLAMFNNLQMLRLRGLTGRKGDDQYLGAVLSAPNPEDGPSISCPDLTSLELEYIFPIPHDIELYLPWLYRVLATRQRASENSGATRAIERVTVDILIGSGVLRNNTNRSAPEHLELYQKVEGHIQEMESRLRSRSPIVFDVCFKDWDGGFWRRSKLVQEY